MNNNSADRSPELCVGQLLDHQFVNLFFVDSMRSTVLFSVSVITVAGVFNVRLAVPESLFGDQTGSAFGTFYHTRIALNSPIFACPCSRFLMSLKQNLCLFPDFFIDNRRQKIFMLVAFFLADYGFVL